MAYIRRNRSRKHLEEGPLNAGATWTRDGILFQAMIGEHRLVMTHPERDELIERWEKQRMELEK